VDGYTVPCGGEGKDQHVGILGHASEGGADADGPFTVPRGRAIGFGQAILSAAEGIDGVTLLGKPLAEVGHAQVSPDDGETRRGR
jgi:hypothetical protein